MFEMYMEGHSVDPRLRARMMMALVASLAVTTAAGMGSWAAGRLSIGRVGPPQGTDIMQLTLLTDVPAEQIEPPKRSDPPPDEDTPSVAAARTTTRPARGKPAALDDGPPTEDPGKRKTVGVSDGDPRGETGIPGPSNQLGCLGAGCVPDAPLGKSPVIGVPPKPKPKVDDTERAPLSVLKARSLYTPDPTVAALAKTKTGLGSRSPGRVKVEFCVGTNGRVSRAKVTQRFGSDPEVDRICKAAVQKWRFRPARVDGKARTTCSDVTFDIRFEG